MQPEFETRNVKVIGLSASGLESYHEWIKNINEVNSVNLKSPIIADADRKISILYEMLDHQDITNINSKGILFTVRFAFIIDSKKTILPMPSYPVSTGHNFDEIL